MVYHSVHSMSMGFLVEENAAIVWRGLMARFLYVLSIGSQFACLPLGLLPTGFITEGKERGEEEGSGMGGEEGRKEGGILG